MKYECPCGYVYDPALGDPDNGVAPGTVWEDVPEDWVCPICGLGKNKTASSFLSGAFGKRFAKYGPDTPRRPGFSLPIMRKNEREDPP